MSINGAWYLTLAAVLFTIGAAGLLVRRNVLVMFMCIELMLNAANLLLVAFARVHGSVDGQVVALLSMAIAASEVVVGLGIIVALSHLRRSLDTDEMTELRG